MSDEITFPQMKGSGSSVATFAIGADGSTLAVVTNGDTVVAFLNMRDEIERLRARVEVLERVREAAEDVAYGYDPDRDMGAIEASVRALIKTLEAKP
jgi:hypothetical protein